MFAIYLLSLSSIISITSSLPTLFYLASLYTVACYSRAATWLLPGLNKWSGLPLWVPSIQLHKKSPWVRAGVPVSAFKRDKWFFLWLQYSAFTGLEDVKRCPFSDWRTLLTYFLTTAQKHLIQRPNYLESSLGAGLLLAFSTHVGVSWPPCLSRPTTLFAF